jgi:hypothetical protein
MYGSNSQIEECLIKVEDCNRSKDREELREGRSSPGLYLRQH